MDNSTWFTGTLTVPQMLRDGLLRGGEGSFAIYQRLDGRREEVSYRQIEQAGRQLAERLAAAGLKKGDRLGVVAALRPWWYSVYYAATLGGYIPVGIDPGVPTGQIHHMLLETEVRAVFTTLSTLTLPEELAGRIPFYGVEEGFPLRPGGSERVDGILPEAAALPEDTFYILYTSGTTAERRKGVLLAQSTLSDAIEWYTATDGGIYKKESPYRHDMQRELMLLPPHRMAGLLNATLGLYCNAQVIMLEKTTPHGISNALRELRPDQLCVPPDVLDSLRENTCAALEHRPLRRGVVNALSGLSGFLRRCLGVRAGRFLLSFLHRRTLGGRVRSILVDEASVEEKTLRFFLNMGVDVPVSYGLAELGGPLSSTGSGYYLNSAGKPSRHGSGLDIRIARPDARGRGEVEVLSPFRMISYLRSEDMEGCFTGDGYFKTGDLGWMNDEGCLVIGGRLEEAITLPDGERLLPGEIEARYRTVEDVSEVCAFRIPGEEGHGAFALGAVKDKSSGVPAESYRLQLLDRATRLPASYRPSEVYMLSEIPLSSSGKPQRFRLTEMVEKGLSAPVSEAALRPVGEEGAAAQLRGLLAQTVGPWWKSAELTEGLPLEMDSLQTIDLSVAVEETFGVDLFQLSSVPETFGALLEAVTEYESMEKNDKVKLDLTDFPQPVRKLDRPFTNVLTKASLKLWHVHGSGMEKLPLDSNYMICSNHITVLDPAWIGAFLPEAKRRRTAIVGKSDLLSIRLYAPLLRANNLIPVDRTGNSMATLNRCLELLDYNWNVLIFPEGTNYEAGNIILPFRDGPARMAIAAGVPVVPVRIKGVKPMDMDNKTFLPPIGGRIDVVFGEPIATRGVQDPAELNELLRAAIEAL